MKKAIFFILSLVIIVVLFFVASFLFPSQVTITKSVMVQADENKITNQISNLENWKNWFPSDSLSWNSQEPDFVNLGKNVKIEKLNSSGEKSFLFQLLEGSKRSTVLHFVLIPQDSGFQITLNATNRFRWYPWGKFRGIFLEKMVGPFYEQLLQNLKKVSES